MFVGKLTGLLLALAAVFLAMLILRPLLPIDETRYLAVAWEMWLSGDLVHLTKNFSFYTHKPPLLFWLINLAWLFTGVSEFVGRLIGPALAIGVVWFTNFLAKKLWVDRPDIGLTAAIVLSGFSVFLLYGSATMFDCLLALPVLLGVSLLWAIGNGDNSMRNWVTFGLALAVGVLAKGPVILVHLMPLVLTMPIWAKQPPKYGKVGKGLGLAICVALAVVALWLVPALITGTPEFRTELLWTQSAARVAGGMAHDRPIWFLAALLPVILFPWAWSIQSWVGLYSGWKSDPALRLCGIWSISSLILFSLISGKQVHYLIPTFPAVAMIFARSIGTGAAPRASLVWLPLALIGVGFLALGTGVIPASGDLATIAPLWPATALGCLCFALALLAWRLPLVLGHTLVGVGVALGLHGLAYSTALFPIYDGKRLADVVTQHAVDGIAVTNLEYNAEFNFAARLTSPIGLPKTYADVYAWAQAHPSGVILGRLTESPLSIAPQKVVKYIGQDWGYWTSASVTSPE